jgi:hypothetical protein
MVKYARRPAPSPVELGIAARFLAPQRPGVRKSILSPVQRDLPPGVPGRMPEPALAHHGPPERPQRENFGGRAMTATGGCRPKKRGGHATTKFEPSRVGARSRIGRPVPRHPKTPSGGGGHPHGFIHVSSPAASILNDERKHHAQRHIQRREVDAVADVSRDDERPDLAAGRGRPDATAPVGALDAALPRRRARDQGGMLTPEYCDATKRYLAAAGLPDEDLDAVGEILDRYVSEMPAEDEENLGLTKPLRDPATGKELPEKEKVRVGGPRGPVGGADRRMAWDQLDEIGRQRTLASPLPLGGNDRGFSARYPGLLAPVHYWDTDIRHLGRSMNVQRLAGSPLCL